LFKKIVLATDFSDRAEIAREVTIHLVKGTKAKVTVVTIYHPSDIMIWHGVFLPSPAAERYEQKVIKQMIKEKLHDYAKKLEKAGIKVDYVMKTGMVANGIIKAAKEAKADLIVLGSHSQRSLGDVLLGGTAVGVQAKSPCPVLIAYSKVKPKPKKKTGGKPKKK
jgi:nucleotide-binding universal stress UspA family protein